MQTNNHQIVDYDLILDQKFGKEGTPERIKAEEDALSFYAQPYFAARLGSASHRPQEPIKEQGITDLKATLSD